MKLRNVLLALCMLATLLPLGIAVAQDGLAKRVLLLGANAEAYPKVVFRVGAYDARGHAIKDLQGKEIAVSVDGQPVTTTLQLEQRSPAIAIVADMSFAMNDQSFPGQGRVSTMVSQIRRMLSNVPKDTPTTLITFDSQERVAANWMPSAALTSTVDALISQPLPAAAPDTPYSLTGAILLALDQFDQPNALASGRPRALFVYAAGVPQRAIETSAIQHGLDELAPNPPLIVLIGLGSSAPGEFASQPGNPESLLQAASTLTGRAGAFRRFFGANPAETELLQEALDQQSEQVANLEQTLLLTVVNPALSPGTHQLELAIHDLSVAQRLRVPAVPPQIALSKLDRPLVNGDVVSVQVQFAQQPVREVGYSLDGQPIGSSTAGPNFVLTIDLARLKLPASAPATHLLEAVATDTAGQQSKRASTTIKLATSVAEADPLSQQPVSLGVLLVLLGLLVVLFFSVAALLVATAKGRAVLRALAGGSAEPQLAAPARSPAGVDTIMVGDDTTTPTAVVQAKSPVAAVEVVLGDQPRSYPISGDRHVSLGRGAGNQIRLTDGQISRRHAKLEPATVGVRLTDLGSDNGTFVGEYKRKIQPNIPELLRPGDSFWVGPNIKLVVR